MNNYSALAGFYRPFASQPALLVAFAVTLVSPVAFGQSETVYDNLSTTATQGYAVANNNNPIFGDSLNLVHGGRLTSFGLSLFNSTSGGNTGNIIKESVTVNFYDNTFAYSSGTITNPLLGTATFDWDFGATPLAAGFYAINTFDLTSFDIVLTDNILVTQQFTKISGTSTRTGVVVFGDPVVGSSPATVFIDSTSLAPNLYAFGAGANQFGYKVEVEPTPEPSTLALLGLGITGLFNLRRRQTSK